MPDRKIDRGMVITHLLIIKMWTKFARERGLQFFTVKHLEDIARWSDDAIALLKEQKEKEEKILTASDGYRMCAEMSKNAYDSLTKLIQSKQG